MADSSISVDLLNPGQVLACLGLLEAADVLLGSAKAAFDWSNGRETTFRMVTANDQSPFQRVMRFLEEAQVVARVPYQSPNIERWKASWGTAPEIEEPEHSFPFPDPDSPATLPILLRDGVGNEIALDYWGDATRRDNMKFWAGAGGYPAAAIVRDALEIVREKIGQHTADPFALSAPQSNSFRFDWRRDYIPVQDGFSPNKHRKTVQMVGFPLVEILAAIGVTNARPRREVKLEYEYSVLGAGRGSPLDPIFHRAALGAATSPIPGYPFRRFVMRLDWPGKEGQARCITQVTERSSE